MNKRQPVPLVVAAASGFSFDTPPAIGYTAKPQTRIITMKEEIEIPQGYRAHTAEDNQNLPRPEGTLVYNYATESWDIESLDCRGYEVYPGNEMWVAIPLDKQNPVTIPDPKQAYGEKKPQLHLIPLAAQEEMARALELGVRKYGERNWLLGDGVNLTTYLSAMARHLALITDGKEDVDPESGAHHLGHIMAGCGIILDAMRHGKLIDNRVKPTPANLPASPPTCDHPGPDK